MPSELEPAQAFLYARLTSPAITGVGTRVYAFPGDSDAADIWITFLRTGGSPTLGTGGYLVGYNSTYLVTVHGRDDMTGSGVRELNAIAAKIDDQVTTPGGPTVTVTDTAGDSYAVSCVPGRQGAFMQTQMGDGGVIWRRVGAFYQLTIQVP